MWCEKDLPSTAGLEDGGRWPQAKERRQPLEDRKGKETRFLLEPTEGIALPTP